MGHPAPVVCLRRVPNIKQTDAEPESGVDEMPEIEVGGVDIDALKDDCCLGTNAPGDVITVGAVLDTGSRVTCVSQALVVIEQRERHLPGQQVVFPFGGVHTPSQVADGRR